MKRNASPTNRSLLEMKASIEQELIGSGITVFCGTDEAGRGPLAGPVVAAAALYRDCEALKVSCDSKILTPEEREERYVTICEQLAYGVGIATVEEIDSLNILRASLLAMQRAVEQLNQPSLQLILVDGNHPLPSSVLSRAVVDGDARVAIIGAASIVAKVTRDRMMKEYDQQFPEYGFGHHMGYATPEHREVLKRIGPCAIHRRTFHGVKEFFPEDP